jgi:hypothetical protein
LNGYTKDGSGDWPLDPRDFAFIHETGEPRTVLRIYASDEGAMRVCASVYAVILVEEDDLLS